MMEDLYIYFCSKCKDTYSNKQGVKGECPKCGSTLAETTILRDTWRDYSDEIKSEMRRAFLEGNYLRTVSSVDDQKKTEKERVYKKPAAEESELESQNERIIHQLVAMNITLNKIYKHTNLFYILTIISLVIVFVYILASLSGCI